MKTEFIAHMGCDTRSIVMKITVLRWVWQSNTKKINNEFTESSGLQGVKSDNFITSKVNLPLNSYLSFQGLIDDKMAAKKSIFNGGFDYKKHLKLNIVIYNPIKWNFVKIRRRMVNK